MSNDEFFDITETVYNCDEFALIIANQLAGIPLFGYYILQVEKYDPADIKGTLMDCPFQFFGPYDTLAEAKSKLRSFTPDDE